MSDCSLAIQNGSAGVLHQPVTEGSRAVRFHFRGEDVYKFIGGHSAVYVSKAKNFTCDVFGFSSAIG